MTPLYSIQEFQSAKSKDLLKLSCEICKSTFKRNKQDIHQSLTNKNSKNKCNYCSNACNNKSNIKKIKLNCSYCVKEIEKSPHELKKSKSGNHFCSKSCATTFKNKNKKTGDTRSKLEYWIEEQLVNLYPNLEIHFNRRDAIKSELDIYIPTLNLAFELNGIFHYEPIFGIDKLQKTKANDIYKSKACYDAKIDLCIIDTSGQKYTKPSTSQKYFDIINNIIKERMLTS
jgi:hypothetical protein